MPRRCFLCPNLYATVIHGNTSGCAFLQIIFYTYSPSPALYIRPTGNTPRTCSTVPIPDTPHSFHTPAHLFSPYQIQAENISSYNINLRALQISPYRVMKQPVLTPNMGHIMP